MEEELYLLQQPPFRFVDRLAVMEDDGAETLYQVTDNTLLMTDDGHMSAGGMVEVMAQTAAAWQGLWAVRHHLEVRPGKIGAVSGMHIYAWPKVGDTLCARMRIVNKVFGVMSIETSIHRDGECICEAKMKIALDD